MNAIGQDVKTITEMWWCARCGGNGYLMRVSDKVLVKCDHCDGSGKAVVRVIEGV